MDTRVLLVEDDITARMLLADVLSSAGYDVITAAEGDAAIRALAEHSFDVVLTDIRMGNVDGIQVLASAKSRPRPPAVILLTGYGSLETAIAALRSGADNYLLKPCEPTDLLACIADAARRRAEQLRQTDAITSITRSIDQLRGLTPAAESETGGAAAVAPEPSLQIGRLAIDSFSHTATFDQQPLHLTPIEYALLRCLAEARGRVLSYSEIVRRTHGHVTNDNDAQLLIKAHIRNLRRKIDPSYLVNVRGTGYRLAAPE
jgi:two-component system, OmpR family, response regulator